MSLHSLQTFSWDEEGHHDPEQQRTYYKGFTLQDTHYEVGQAVYLFPESDGLPHYLGRIQSAFADSSPNATDVHCIQIRWFERYTNLEPSAVGVMHDRELVELEEADINPIGCLAGPATVLCVNSCEEAELLASHRGLHRDWFYCRGIFKQSTGEFILYDGMAPGVPPNSVPRRPGSRASEDVGDSDDICMAQERESCQKRVKIQHLTESAVLTTEPLGGSLMPTTRFDKGPGRQCVDCGATSTPQWREGPRGPKTLCNACGVRYNRLRASKRNGSIGPRQPKTKSLKTLAKQDDPPDTPHTCTIPLPTRMMPAEMSQQQQQQQQQQQPISTSGRPARQAALLSANRTASYARTGVFPIDGECPGLPGPAFAQPRSLAGSCVGVHPDDMSHHSSESGEEQFVTSGAHPVATNLVTSSQLEPPAGCNRQEAAAVPAAAHPVMHLAAGATTVHTVAYQVGMVPPSDFSVLGGSDPDVGTDNLELQDTSMAATNAPLPCQDSAAGSILRGVALRAVSYCPDAAEFGEVFTNFEAVHAQLPADVVQQLRYVTEQVDRATSEAAAADADLLSIQQALALRQKTADTAREKAAAAAERLKVCMADLVQQYRGKQTQPCGSTEQQTGQLSANPAHELHCHNSGSKALLDRRMSWGQLDHEHVSLLESNLFDGATDNGAALINVDCAFGSALIKVQN